MKNAAWKLIVAAAFAGAINTDTQILDRYMKTIKEDSAKTYKTGTLLEKYLPNKKEDTTQQHIAPKTDIEQAYSWFQSILKETETQDLITRCNNPEMGFYDYRGKYNSEGFFDGDMVWIDTDFKNKDAMRTKMYSLLKANMEYINSCHPEDVKSFRTEGFIRAIKKDKDISEKIKLSGNPQINTWSYTEDNDVPRHDLIYIDYIPDIPEIRLNSNIETIEQAKEMLTKGLDICKEMSRYKESASRFAWYTNIAKGYLAETLKDQQLQDKISKLGNPKIKVADTYYGSRTDQDNGWFTIKDNNITIDIDVFRQERMDYLVREALEKYENTKSRILTVKK